MDFHILSVSGCAADLFLSGNRSGASHVYIREEQTDGMAGSDVIDDANDGNCDDGKREGITMWDLRMGGKEETQGMQGGQGRRAARERREGGRVGREKEPPTSYSLKSAAESLDI